MSECLDQFMMEKQASGLNQGAYVVVGKQVPTIQIEAFDEKFCSLYHRRGRWKVPRARIISSSMFPLTFLVPLGSIHCGERVDFLLSWKKSIMWCAPYVQDARLGDLITTVIFNEVGDWHFLKVIVFVARCWKVLDDFIIRPLRYKTTQMFKPSQCKAHTHRVSNQWSYAKSALTIHSFTLYSTSWGSTCTSDYSQKNTTFSLTWEGVLPLFFSLPCFFAPIT